MSVKHRATRPFARNARPIPIRELLRAWPRFVGQERCSHRSWTHPRASPEADLGGQLITISSHEHVGGDVDTHCLGRLEIEDQFDLGREIDLLAPCSCAAQRVGLAPKQQQLLLDRVAEQPDGRQKADCAADNPS
jgi:hypothetical protein